MCYVYIHKTVCSNKLAHDNINNLCKNPQSPYMYLLGISNSRQVCPPSYQSYFLQMSKAIYIYIYIFVKINSRLCNITMHNIMSTLGVYVQMLRGMYITDDSCVDVCGSVHSVGHMVNG